MSCQRNLHRKKGERSSSSFFFFVVFFCSSSSSCCVQMLPKKERQKELKTCDELQSFDGQGLYPLLETLCTKPTSEKKIDFFNFFFLFQCFHFFLLTCVGSKKNLCGHSGSLSLSLSLSHTVKMKAEKSVLLLLWWWFYFFTSGLLVVSHCRDIFWRNNVRADARLRPHLLDGDTLTSTKGERNKMWIYY